MKALLRTRCGCRREMDVPFGVVTAKGSIKVPMIELPGFESSGDTRTFILKFTGIYASADFEAEYWEA